MRCPPIGAERPRSACQHAASDARDTHAGHVVELVRCPRQNRLGGAQAAADRRSDAFAQVAARKPGRIPRDEGVVAPHDIDAPAQVIAVTRWIVVRTAGEAAAELLGEVRPMGLDVLSGVLDAPGEAADADVEPAALFRHVPGVTGESLVAEPQVAVGILPRVLDLVLERHDLQLMRARVRLLEKTAIDGAARAARADEIAAAILAVDDEPIAVGEDFANVVLLDGHPGALQEPGVELEAADGVLHARHRQAEASVVHAQPRESEQAMRVGVEVHLELAHHLGRDPAGAQLQSRKALAIEQQHLGAGALQAPGGARARGTPADDQYLARAHGDAGFQVYRCARVQGTSLLSEVAKTTWKSCSVPVEKAASEPARYSRHMRTKRSSNIPRTLSPAFS